MTTKSQNTVPQSKAPQQNTLPMQYDVRVHSLRLDGNCRAHASVNINGSFAVRGVKVMESSKGLFVSMPSYRAGNGEYKDICFPVTKEARQEFDSAVLNAYQQALSQQSQQAVRTAPDPTLQQSSAPEMTI